MLLFNYEVRESFTPSPMNGEIKAKDRADAFNKIVEIYTYELSTCVTELKISIWEADQ